MPKKHGVFYVKNNGLKQLYFTKYNDFKNNNVYIYI
jgi:hypothetical protein